MILQSQLPTYQMRVGDTLYSVARRHGVTPKVLLSVNPNISPSTVRAGTVVRIPYAGMATSAAMPPSGAPGVVTRNSVMPDDVVTHDRIPESATPDTAMTFSAVMDDQMPEENKMPDIAMAFSAMPDDAMPDDAMPHHEMPHHEMRDSAPQPASLRNEMRALWEQHVWWTRELMISILSSLPNEAEVTSRLLMNPDQVAALFRPTFGDQAAQTISRLLTDHLVVAVELMKASRENDAEAAEDANRRWNENADAIAAVLASLGPQFPVEEMRQTLYRHLDLTREELAARLAGDHQRDIDAFDAVEQHALMIADALTEGIAQAGQ